MDMGWVWIVGGRDENVPPGAGATDHVKVITGKGYFLKLLLILDPLHDFSEYEKFRQAAYTTTICRYE